MFAALLLKDELEIPANPEAEPVALMTAVCLSKGLHCRTASPPPALV